MKRIICTVLWDFLIIPLIASADGSYPHYAKAPGLQSVVDKYRKALDFAAKQTGAIKRYDQPRQLKDGAKPEIRIVGKDIFFNKKLLPLGGPISLWIDRIGRNADCINNSRPPVTCRWNALGLRIHTDAGGKVVETFDIYLKLPDDLAEGLATAMPDGSPGSADAGHLPRSPFTGYFELDGYGIDKDTMFWEVRSSIQPTRGLRCGLRDCQFPSGVIAPDTEIYMVLNGPSERDRIGEISIVREARN